MKKNAIKHMDPPKRGFGSFFRKLHIIPFLLCVLLAVLFWLVTANINNAKTAKADTDAEEAETEVEETAETASGASLTPIFYVL